MDPETAIRIADLQSWIGILAVTVVLLCCYITAQPEIDKRLAGRVKAPDFCPLHRGPVSECLDRHKLGGPDEPSELE